MWSGPRNISTALMRSWGNRADTLVVDEPFYGLYLERTGKAHPAAMEIVSRTETDPHKIVGRILAPLPPGKLICYQKQMTHHLLPEIDRSWLLRVTNCFLKKRGAISRRTHGGFWLRSRRGTAGTQGRSRQLHQRQREGRDVRLSRATSCPNRRDVPDVV